MEPVLLDCSCLGLLKLMKLTLSAPTDGAGGRLSARIAQNDRRRPATIYGRWLSKLYTHYELLLMVS